LNREHILAQLLLRAWPFQHGAGRLTDRFFGKLQFSESLATVRTTDGFDIRVMPNDLIGRHLYLTGEFDRTNADILIRYSQPGDTLLDIGANIGYVSACFLQNVPGSRVIAVEPNPEVSAVCHSNLGQFGGRAKVVQCALSDISGQLPFEINSGNTGASRLATHASAATVSVPVFSANQFFIEQNLQKVDLIKIDVEGHETQILRSAAPYLRILKPRVMLYEDNGGVSTRGEVGSLLRELGYEIYGLKKRLTRVDLIKGFYATNDHIAMWQNA
jgi:FkbM family methyltransferase